MLYTMKFNLPHHFVLFKTYRSIQKEKKTTKSVPLLFTGAADVTTAITVSVTLSVLT